MKKSYSFIQKTVSMLLSFIVLTGFLPAFSAFAAGTGTLNVSEISFRQAELCAEKTLDGFDGEECIRSPLDGTALYVDSSDAATPFFEGGSFLALSGKVSERSPVGCELAFSKHPDTPKIRSVGLAVYIKPGEDGISYKLKMTVTGTSSSAVSEGAVVSGVWQTAFFPVADLKPGALVSVKVEILSDKETECEAALDYLHSSKVDGMPEDLPLFASGFTAFRGKVSVNGGTLTFEANGKDCYIQSEDCNYLISEKYNTLAVTLKNETVASHATLYCDIDGSGFTAANSQRLSISSGEATYYFKIGTFEKEYLIKAIRLAFEGKLKGKITVSRIELLSYRYPVQYPGTLSAQIKDGTVTVTGSVKELPKKSTKISLYRLLPGDDEERFDKLDAAPYLTKEASAEFSFSFPRYEDGRDNALYKYFAVFEGGGSSVPVHAAVYTQTTYASPLSPGLMGITASSDLSFLSEAEPDTAYLNVFVPSLYRSDGEISSSENYELTLNADQLAKYDAIVSKCESIGSRVMIKLEYDGVLPDITDEEAVLLHLNVISFLLDRYGDSVCGVIPCGALNSAEALIYSDLSEERLAAYSSDIVRLSVFAASGYGVRVYVPFDAGGGADLQRFLTMLYMDTAFASLPFSFIVDVGGASNYIKAVSYFNGRLQRGVVLASPFPSDLVSFLNAFYGFSGYCDGVYFYGETDDPEISDFIKKAAAAEGVKEAERLIPGLAMLYPVTGTFTKRYSQTEICEDELPQAVTVIYDGKTTEGWLYEGNCRGVYQGSVNGEPAAELAFDFTISEVGSASYYPQDAFSGDTLYLKIYTDYLPANESGIKVQIRVYHSGGCIYGDSTLAGSATSVLCVKLDEKADSVNRIVIKPYQNENETLTTPRICVAGIYSSGENSADTVNEDNVTTVPEPDTQIFATDEITQPAPVREENETGLLIISICVMAGMFVICGLTIFILKTVSQKKEQNKKSEIDTDRNESDDGNGPS